MLRLHSGLATLNHQRFDQRERLTSLRRRSLIAAAGWAAVLRGVGAQPAYPERAVKVVVPFGAGTSPDVGARLWGDRLSRLVSQPVVVDNRAGAASIIGTQAVVSAPADGYSLLYAVVNTVSINPYVYKTLPYKVSDLQPVSHVLSVPLVMVVSSKSPIRSLQDLIAAARENPHRLTYATYGVGTSMHVAMGRFMTMAGISMTHVPYRDSPINDVASGIVDVLFEPSTTALGHLKAGRLRALGHSSSKPVAALPNVAPIANTFPSFAGDSWHGIFVRSGTPQPVVERLNALSQQIIDSEDFRNRLLDLGLVPGGGSVASFQKFLAEDAAVWSKVVRDYGITAE